MYKKRHFIPYGCGFVIQDSSDDSSDSPAASSSDSPAASSSNSKNLSSVAVFRRLAREIKRNRTDLQESFCKTVWFPNKNDMEWCSFCLGSHICQEIYGEKTPGEKMLYHRNLPSRKFPLLSIVLHMDPCMVKLVISYLHQWFLIKGMKNVISMWLYALLACLDRSDKDSDRDRLLEGIFKDCRYYLRSCGEWQKPRVRLIMSILENYFYILPDNDS